MGFKHLSLFVIWALLSTACTYDNTDPNHKDLDKVGVPLKSVSVLKTDSTKESGQVAIFDETVRVIHVFDLGKMKHLRAHKVLNPKLKHHILFYEEGGYVVDLTDKHLSVYMENGEVVHEPVKFVGTPVSAAFKPKQGLLVVYDDVMSVSMLKLSPKGKVLDAWVSGPIVELPEEKKSSKPDDDEDSSPFAPKESQIRSGDVNDRGELVLGLVDNSIVIVDLIESIESKSKKIKKTFKTELKDIKWVGPIPGNPAQVLVHAGSKVALVDLDLDIQVAEMDLFEINATVSKYSKAIDPHIVIFEDDYWSQRGAMIYAENNEIKTRKIFNQRPRVLSSQLDLANGSWTYVNAENMNPGYYNDVNEHKTGRKLYRYEIASMMAVNEKSLPDKARIEMAESYVFALFPSELGYAQRLNLEGKKVAELRWFNYEFMK